MAANYSASRNDNSYVRRMACGLGEPRKKKRQSDNESVSHITQGSPSDVRQMSGSDVEYIFLLSSGQPNIRFGCPMDVIIFCFDRPQQRRRTF
ncbi:hypothetical protein OUZ56_011586 [Daphnia magna]|uniref:Uncharacterized protein n=1 Tax=Daphnia magna TaxID=35525 RepID=A0ABQ9Z0K5_9CRUS|nr:hypothetical protein OUZ56_011586 [Daphnia magna]